MHRPLSAIFALACASTAFSDAVVLKTGERFVGEVSEEGDAWRIRSDRFPDGVVVKKAGGTFKCEVAVDDVVLVTDVTPQAKEHPKDGRVWWRHSFSEKERKVVDGYRTAAMPFALRVVEGK